VAELADFLDLTAGQARQQFRELRRRSPVSSGRHATFLPIETLLSLTASFLVNHRRFGGSTAYQAPEPVPTLARLFSRPPSSVLAKMANLDGSRSDGGASMARVTHRYQETQRRTWCSPSVARPLSARNPPPRSTCG
jgi:putative restriction endonuclease